MRNFGLVAWSTFHGIANASDSKTRSSGAILEKVPGAAPVKVGRGDGAESAPESVHGDMGGRKVSAAAGEGQRPPSRQSRKPTGVPLAERQGEQVCSTSPTPLVPSKGPEQRAIASSARKDPATEPAGSPKLTTPGTRKKPGKPSQEEIAAMRAAKKAGTEARVQKKSKAEAPGKPHVPKLEKGAADPGKTFRAVAEGNFRQLDPVTGDASCQMRVPFMLDAMDILAASDSKPASLTSGFSSAYGPEFNTLPRMSVQEKAPCPNSAQWRNTIFRCSTR